MHHPQEEEARAEEAERRASQFEGVSTEVLREYVEAALSEAQLAAERQQLLQVGRCKCKRATWQSSVEQHCALQTAL